VVVGGAFPLGYGYYNYAPIYPAAQPVYLYCQNPPGYYPQIQYCPTGWTQVVQ